VELFHLIMVPEHHRRTDRWHSVA